jgi:uncharacterized protein (DUF1684 family)
MSSAPAKGAYASRIARQRQEKDDAFRYESWSPVDPHERTDFEGLSYFAPDGAWQLKAKFRRLADGGIFEMPTSTGEPRQQLRFARLEFTTRNGPAALFAYKNGDDPHEHTLFVPFRDATSGKETYGAGRYLDLEEPEGDELVLDLNLAYNPYCAYSEAYSCPLPPPENWLKIAVTAGEKNFTKH